MEISHLYAMIRLYLIAAIVGLFIISTASSCSPGYGCEATERMESPFSGKDTKKKARKARKGKTQSGLYGNK